jgi:hypothetical protein
MVPYEIAGQTTALKVTIAGQTAPILTLNVALTAPGIFTRTGPVGNGDQGAVLSGWNGKLKSQPGRKGFRSRNLRDWRDRDVSPGIRRDNYLPDQPSPAGGGNICND